MVRVGPTIFKDLIIFILVFYILQKLFWNFRKKILRHVSFYYFNITAWTYYPNLLYDLNLDLKWIAYYSSNI